MTDFLWTPATRTIFGRMKRNGHVSQADYPKFSDRTALAQLVRAGFARTGDHPSARVSSGGKRSGYWPTSAGLAAYGEIEKEEALA